jgi:lambda family phage portal protein
MGTLLDFARRLLGRSGRPVVKNQTEYDAGASTRRTAGWGAPTSSANSGVLSNLSTLRDRSRTATRNDGYAKSVIDKLVTNIIGTGLQPLSQAQDPAMRRAIQALWLTWTDESDADGVLDFYGQQSQAVRTWLEGGEAFARIRLRLPSDGLSVPLQVQLLEPELCPHRHNVLTGTTRIRAGIEFNGIGKRVAYWFHPTRPEQDDFNASELRRIPIETLAHLYDPLRPGQLRGIPHLTQALIQLHELDKFDDATLLRQQLSNMFVAFLKREATSGDAEAFHPLTGAELETSEDSKPMVPLSPGLFQELEPGEEVEFSDPPDAAGYADFMRQQLYGVAAATGVPYEVITGDMTKVNDRTVRVILNEFRRRVQGYQHQIVVFQLCRPIWRAWMDRVFFSGALPIPDSYLTDPSPWAAVKWMPQGWPYLHPVQDVQANKEAVRAGFKSRRAVVAELGDDVEVIDDEQRDDNARADALGLQYDSDGRTDQQPAAAPTPQSEPEPEPAGAPA